MWYGRCTSTLYKLFLPPGVSDFWSFPPTSWSLTTCHRNPLSGSPSLEGLCITPYSGTGILTSYPSPTPFGLGLGPSNPTRTDLPSETLDIRCGRFALPFRYSYQHSHFQPLQQPSRVCLHRCWNAPLPLSRVSRFGGRLSPVQLSAHMRLTSELLRTL